MEEVFRQLGLLKAQECIWLLQVLEVVLAVILRMLIPGLIFWLVILGVVFVWHRVGKLGRVLALAVGLTAVWLEWNFLAAFLAVAGIPSWIGPLCAALTLLVAGIDLCISAVCVVSFCKPSLVDRLADWLMEEKNRDGRDCGLD